MVPFISARAPPCGEGSAKSAGPNVAVSASKEQKAKLLMDTALTLTEAEQAFANDRPVDSVLVFLASRSRKSARELPAPASEVFKGIAEVADQLVMNVIEKRTAAEFKEAFESSFPKYAAITLSLSQFASVIVTPDVRERLTRESICELEADFRDKALVLFGASARDQAMFTIWTLRKISDLLTQIAVVKMDGPKEAQDREYCQHFNFFALRAKFSLDCLNMALHLNRALYPDVMEGLKDGLRSMVNAYAWARRGASLRTPTEELPFEAAESDDEDEELLRASMQDMALLVDEPVNGN